MALLAQATDYTDKDFDSLRLRLQNLVRSVFPEWTDFNVASFGNLLVELYAFVGDVIGFYQDNQARESRIATATQRKNLIALTKLLGFRPAVAARACARPRSPSRSYSSSSPTSSSLRVRTRPGRAARSSRGSSGPRCRRRCPR